MAKVVVVFLFVAAGFFVFSNFLPVDTSQPLRSFVVLKGDGLKSISSRLQSDHFIRSSSIFIISAYLNGLNDKLQAGTFQISGSQSPFQIATRLASGGSTDYWLRLIEGWRQEEVASYLAPHFNPNEFLLKTKQGYIFPDSYLVPEHYTLDQFLSLVSLNFDTKFTQAKKNPTSSLNDSQVIILASILEREAKTLDSKKTIAGIIANRLQINMALQIDATVQFARDSKLPRPTDYWQPVNPINLKINSPYNTYLNTGLPPAPICNPGFDSLYAAFHPTPSDYLFYITGTDGQMHYAKTLEEHNANIAKYLK